MDWVKLTYLEVIFGNCIPVSPQIANYHAELHSVGRTRMWARAQTLPLHCKGLVSRLLAYILSFHTTNYRNSAIFHLLN